MTAALGLHESMPSHTVPLAVVLDRFVPGSYDQPWSWDDERDSLDEMVCRATGIRGGYQQRLETYLRARGRVEQPILLGDDGRVWDGHHRVVAAIRLGYTVLPAECYCDTETRCVAAVFAV